MRSAKLIQRLLKLAAIIMPLALVLAACAPAAAPPATPTPPLASAPSPVATYTISGPTIDRIKNAGKVAVLVDTSLPPWVYVDQNGQIVGADVDIANEFAKDLGVSLDLVSTHWATIFEDLTSGKGDAIISNVGVTEERKNYMLFSTPYYNSGLVIVVRQDNDSIKGLNDLAGKVVGVLVNSTGKPAVEGIGVKEIREYPTITDALNAVTAGEVDATIATLVTADDYMKNHPEVKLASPQPFIRIDTAIAVRKDSPDLQTFANQFIDNIKSDGRLDQILSKYFLE